LKFKIPIHLRQLLKLPWVFLQHIQNKRKQVLYCTNYLKNNFTIVIISVLICCISANTQNVQYPPVIYKIYSTLPDLKNGKIGILANSEKLKALNELNKIRALHKLPPVVYSEKHNLHMNKASLIIAANGKLTHNPQKNFKFYSKEGGWGCFNGNLYIEKHTLLSYKKNNVHLNQLNMNNALLTLNPEITKTESIIDAFIIDEKVPSLGHRRWMLNPFFYSTSYGRVDGFALTDNYHFITSAALKVMNYYKTNNKNNIENKTLPNFIAYPFENYPRKLFKRYWYLSFSVISDKKNFWKNKIVSFSGASISIVDENGYNCDIHSVKYDNLPTGLPNNLQWKVKNIKFNTKYYVKINNVIIGKQLKNYHYWFKLTDTVHEKQNIDFANCNNINTNH